MKASMADIPEPCKSLLNACKDCANLHNQAHTSGLQSILVAANRSITTYSGQRADFFRVKIDFHV